MTAFAVAVALSGVLGLAAYAKFTHPNKAKRLLESADGSEYVLQDPIIAGFEVAVILALLIGHRLKLAWVAVTLMFGGFAGYAVVYLLRGESCGCFGDLFTPPIWMTFVIDIMAVAIGVGLLRWRGLVLTFLGALMLSGAGYGFASATAPLTPDQIERQLEREKQQRQPDSPGSTDDAADHADGVVRDGVGGSGDASDASERDGSIRGDAGDAAASDDTSAALPGRIDGVTAPERLLRSDLLADVRSETVGEGAPAYYVFVHDPDCPICAEKMLFVEQYRLVYPADDSVLRVAEFEKLEIERLTRGGRERAVEFSAWRGSPVAFVVRQGRVTNVYRNDAVPTPEDVRGDLDFEMLEPNFPE